VYETTLKDYYLFIDTKGTSKRYNKDLITYCNKFFNKNIKTVLEFRREFKKTELSNKYLYLSLRSWISFCEENELLEDIILMKLRKVVKKKTYDKVDTYVPSPQEVSRSIDIVKEKSSKFYIIYKLLLDSGCRFSEIREMITNFDKTKIEYYENIVVYRNFHLRGSKSSFYLFFTLETFELFMKEKISLSDCNSLQDYAKRNDLVSVKYLRKYQFTLMIKTGVEFELANFIQGRASRNIGFNHYLAKKELALREYKKVI
jgi:intergrase/recombinase